MARGEIKRFIDKFGLAGVLDSEGKPYVEAGFKYLKLSEEDALVRIEREPRLLRLPLVRAGKAVSIGGEYGRME